VLPSHDVGRSLADDGTGRLGAARGHTESPEPSATLSPSIPCTTSFASSTEISSRPIFAGPHWCQCAPLRCRAQAEDRRAHSGCRKRCAWCRPQRGNSRSVGRGAIAAVSALSAKRRADGVPRRPPSQRKDAQPIAPRMATMIAAHTQSADISVEPAESEDRRYEQSDQPEQRN